MNLEKVAVTIRPRGPWEAIDIGFVVARAWFIKLWLLWLPAASLSLLVALGAGALLPGPAVKWAFFLFWLGKSLYEPPLLVWAGKALFGEQKSVAATLAETRRLLSFRMICRLLLARLSPFRSFVMPVFLLEGAEGIEKKNRLALLKNKSEIVVLLTVAGFCIEVMLALSLMILLFWLVPEELRWVDFGSFIFKADNWFLLFCYVVACSLVAPLYVASGFMMYISRRVALEAWDIEIGFKRIGRRLQRLKSGLRRSGPVLVLALLLSVSVFATVSPAAHPDPETARRTINEVLEKKEFGEKVKKFHWVAKEKGKTEEKSFWAELWLEFFKMLGKISQKIAPLLAGYGEFLLWCGAGIILALGLFKYSRLRDWLEGRFGAAGRQAVLPRVMFGLNLAPESLPEDLVAACAGLLAEGNKRAALGLLYRGTLSRLVHRHRLPVHGSFTEKECCDQVCRSRPAAEASFFEELTGLWIFLAYGHRDPEIDDCRRLTDRWRELFGDTA